MQIKDDQRSARMRRKRNWIGQSAFVLLAVGAGVFMSLRPWKAWQQQVDVRKSAQHELQLAEKRHEELLRQRAHAESDMGQEELVRKDGFVGRGERPITTGD